MDQAILVALGGTAALLLVLLVLLVVLLAGRRRDRGDLAAARIDVEELRSRLDALVGGAGRHAAGPHGAAPRDGAHPAEFVITGVPAEGADRDPAADADADAALPSTRVVLSESLAEPLVKALAFGYGVRRALSPENRNRIAFEMRREVKRARKQRRREARAARRGAQAVERAAMAAEEAA